MKKTKGFTLIELMIVICVIGIVAAIAIPNLLIAYQKGRQKVTMANMRTLGAGVESYATDFAFIPQVATGPMTALQPILVPFYIDVFPDRDGWGMLLRWECAVDGSDNYSIVSWGRDKATGGPFGAPVAGVQYTVTHLMDFDNDIVYCNGAFSFRPKI